MRNLVLTKMNDKHVKQELSGDRSSRKAKERMKGNEYGQHTLNTSMKIE
jgi:hypothetical protein